MNWLIAAAIIVPLVVLAAGSRFLFLWIQAAISGARVGLVNLLLMPLRNIDPATVVKCKIMAVQSGLSALSTQEIEAHLLAGGNAERVTLALIAANRSNIPLDWNTAAAIDLAGRDILEAVRVSVYPKVIECPDASQGVNGTLDGIAKDGIQLKVRVMVTVRTNLVQLIGGATEATIVGRVGQSIIAAIGSCETYQEALCDPMVITRKVLEQGLDAQTVFAILSIDIADIDVGVNIGAQLQVDQADADVRVARADAETRRAMALAEQQEMVARVTASHAHVLDAEAGVPLAMAHAITQGRIRSRHAPPPSRRRGRSRGSSSPRGSRNA